MIKIRSLRKHSCSCVGRSPTCSSFQRCGWPRTIWRTAIRPTAMLRRPRRRMLARTALSSRSFTIRRRIAPAEPPFRWSWRRMRAWGWTPTLGRIARRRSRRPMGRRSRATTSDEAKPLRSAASKPGWGRCSAVCCSLAFPHRRWPLPRRGREPTRIAVRALSSRR